MNPRCKESLVSQRGWHGDSREGCVVMVTTTRFQCIHGEISIIAYVPLRLSFFSRRPPSIFLARLPTVYFPSFMYNLVVNRYGRLVCFLLRRVRWCCWSISSPITLVLIPRAFFFQAAGQLRMGPTPGWVHRLHCGCPPPTHSFLPRSFLSLVCNGLLFG